MIDNTNSKSAPNAGFNQDKISGSGKSDTSEIGKEEEILELTDVIEEISGGKTEELADLAAYAQEVDDEPMEVKASPDRDSAKGADLETIDDFEKGIERAAEDDIAGALGMDLNGKQEQSTPEFPIGTPLEDAITPEVLEDALERVIMRMFSEKIEPLLVGAVERGVQKEIERLRAFILEDGPDARKP